MINKPKILIYDIEVSPCQGWFWRTGKTVIGHNQIWSPGKIICISYRFTDWPDTKVVNLKWDSTQSDEKLVKQFYKVAEEADVIVGHNGDSFDKKWINTRLAYYEHPTIRHVDTEDTLKMCRRQFNMASFRLDYICKFFKIPGKLSTSSDLWERVVRFNDRKALKEMGEYCDNDVIILDKLWKRIYPYVNHKINMSVYTGSDVCPECGDKEYSKWGTRMTRAGTYQRFRCNKCCHVFSDKKMVTSAEMR